MSQKLFNMSGSRRMWPLLAVLAGWLASCGSEVSTDTPPEGELLSMVVACAVDAGAEVRWDPFTYGWVDASTPTEDLDGNVIDRLTDTDIAIYRRCMEDSGIEFVDPEILAEENRAVPGFVDCMRGRGYDIEVEQGSLLVGGLGFSSVAGQQPNDVIDVDMAFCANEVDWDLAIEPSS